MQMMKRLSGYKGRTVVVGGGGSDGGKEKENEDFPPFIYRDIDLPQLCSLG